jgi:hypothetical protein
MARRINRVSPTGDPIPDVELNDSENDVTNEFETNENDDGTGTARCAPTPPPPRRPPNPVVMKNDPMAELFGPGSTIKQIGDPDDEMPDEIRGVIEENGLARKDFQCVLKSIPDGTLNESVDNSSISVYIRAWKRSIPTMDFIAREYGPGNYILVLSWRVVDREEGISKNRREVVPIAISDKCAAEYKKHQLNKKISDASDTGTKVREAIVEKTIEGQLISALTGGKEDHEKKQSPKEYLEELMGTVKMLGLPVGGFGGGGAPTRIEWEKYLPAIMTGATALLGVLQQASARRAEEQNKLFMLMLSQNQNSSQQMMEMVKIQATKPAADNPLKDLQQMVMSAMDIKQMMNPEKETVSDKIFRVVEMVAPQILTIAATAAQNQQPPRGPAVDIAKMYVKSNPDFEKLKNDPAEMVKFVQRLDERIGWENADVVLAVVEWGRPQNCPRDPAKRYPPQDQAVDAQTEDIAPQDA